jgi:two-component system, response regulator PdtaR
MAQIRLLIAEDESIIRANLRESLQGLGYLVVGETGDGTSAITMARQLKPDLVLMDVRLPITDGITAATTLYREGIAPVVLLTAYSSRDLIEQARNAGVAGYLVKPVREGELTPAIEVARARWVELMQQQRELGALRDQLETRKVIERAKGYLMDSQGLKEAEAFRKMQQLAMNSRRSMREVAQAILLTQHLSV